MKKKILYNQNILIITCFVFVLFFICSYWTPLAGDDWGYAINGMKANPFIMAIQFYYSWSGRFFSELWGFIVAPNKWLWNILNPLLFSLIFVCVNLLANPSKKFLHAMMVFMIMLFVSANLRMETYTWIMGTTYVVPLCFSLLFLVCVYYHIVEENQWTKKELMICAFLVFYIGLCMENIAGVMILANLLLLVRMVFHKKNWSPYLAFLIIGIISFVILRSSPGSAYRLSENTAWLEMSFIEQVVSNIPAFLRYTFYDNKYLVGILTILTFCLILQKKSYRISFLTVSSILMSMLSCLFLISNKLYSLTGMQVFGMMNAYAENTVSMLVNVVFWCLYIIYLFVVFAHCFSGIRLEMVMFFLLLAGASNIVMLISPIFGSRSSLYFYYFSLILLVIVLDEIKIQNTIHLLVLSALIVLTLYRGYDTVKKYKMVDRVHQDRLIKIQYYLDHPEEKDVWLPRMPIYTVHGADIEVDDTYHMNVFKQYYGLNDDCILHFYIED